MKNGNLRALGVVATVLSCAVGHAQTVQLGTNYVSSGTNGLIANGLLYANQFTVGANSFVVGEATAFFFVPNNFGTNNVKAYIVAEVANLPGSTPLVAFTATNKPVGLSNAYDVTFTLDSGYENVTLSANTNYWFYLAGETDNFAQFSWGRQLSNDSPAPSNVGTNGTVNFSVARSSFGSPWASEFGGSTRFRFAISSAATTSGVPEPSAVAFASAFAAGLGGLIVVRRRK